VIDREVLAAIEGLDARADHVAAVRLLVLLVGILGAARR
jgi:hypothetical protein